MFGFVIALLLIIALFAVARAVQGLVYGVGPAHAALRQARITHTVRRESADLDDRYEQLLRS